jgi:hypothetical protein
VALREGALGRFKTRADQVRARRARQPRKVEPAPREKRPKRSRKKRARRRYDITLDRSAGVEARLPAVPSVRMGTRWLSLVLSIATLLVLGRTTVSSAYSVRETVVRGNRLLSAVQVRTIAHVEGESGFFVDPQAVERRLLRFPEVKAVQVHMRWPDGMLIEIEERSPMVAWEDAGRLWWLGRDGIAFIPHGQQPGLVSVKSEEKVLNVQKDSLIPVIDASVLHSAAALQAQLPEGERLIYDAIHGLGYIDSQNREVYFGTDGDMQQKVRVYQAIKAHLESQSIPASYVSLEDISAPYYSVDR